MAFANVELPDDVARALERAAGEMQSSPGALLLRAARSFLAELDAYEAAIAEGEADLEAGRLVLHEDVMAEMRDWAAGLRAPRAAE